MTFSKKNRILWQILVWTVAWLLIIFLLSDGLAHPFRFLRRGLATFVGIAIVIFTNSGFLLPRFYFQKKRLAFIVSGIALLIGVLLLLNLEIFPWSDWFNPHGRASAIFYENIADRMGRRNLLAMQWSRQFMPLFITFLGSTLWEITNITGRKEKEKLEAEVKFLKSQINPHFLFNALNNIYTLTIIKSDKASENLHRLSDMLRYMLYDSNVEKVALKKEIAYLQNYINLALLKDSRGLNINFSFDDSRPDLMIAPLLFIPFVENAFKHSQIEDLETEKININLKTYENHLEFRVENTIPQDGLSKDKVGGIGLVNVKHRLELLYPGKHFLEIGRSENLFSVFLKLDLL
jgi:two-component system LytT family sensor kinase